MSASEPPPPLPLFFSVHSGTGNQLQALTAAVFVANATGRAVFVPPWLPYRQMPIRFMRDPTSMVSRRCRAQHVEDNKQKLSHFSEAMLCKLCKSTEQLDKFESVYALHELVQPLPAMTTERCKQCKEVLRLCPRIDLDPHQLVLAKEDRNRARWPWSNAGNNTAKADCQQNFVHLQPTRASCARLLQAVNDASNLLPRSKRSAFCLGPLNDWFFEKPFGKDSTLVGRCKSSYPIAARLTRSGLPLRRELVALVPRLFPNPCDVCIYVRLHDRRNKTLANLHEALYSWTGRRLVQQLIDRHRNDPKQVRAGGVELVSTCMTAECRNPLSTASTSRTYWAVTNLTRESFQTHGPAILARLPDDAQLRAGWAEMQRLGVSSDNQRTLYDQLRCARCRTIRGMSAGSNRNPNLRGKGGLSVRSTFFETIVHLHHQLRDRGIVTGEEVKKIIGAEVESAAPGYSYWKCDQDNKKKQCVEYTKSREFRGGRG